MGYSQRRVPLLFTRWPPYRSSGHMGSISMLEPDYDAAHDLREYIQKIIEELKD